MLCLYTLLRVNKLDNNEDLFMKLARCIVYSSMVVISVATNYSVAETYSSTIAKGYATGNYNKYYTKSALNFWTTVNPFPDLGSQTSGGNCTNFASQSILAGLTGKTSPVDVYNQRNSFLIERNDGQSWYLTCNEPKVGSGSTDCRSFSWGLVANMKLYADDSINRTSTKKGLRFQFVTKTSLASGILFPLDYTKVKVGDIIFADFNYNYKSASNIPDHTMIVTEIMPLAKAPDNYTTVEKYNTIRLTYQTLNKTGVKLGDFYAANKALYVYRPIDYKR